MRRSTLFTATVSSLLAACSGPLQTDFDARPEPEIRTVEVQVPVAVGCAGKRPEPVLPINRRIAADAWAAKPPGAKGAAVRAQAGRHLNYADQLKAATDGCADAPH